MGRNIKWSQVMRRNIKWSQLLGRNIKWIRKCDQVLHTQKWNDEKVQFKLSFRGRPIWINTTHNKTKWKLGTEKYGCVPKTAFTIPVHRFKILIIHFSRQNICPTKVSFLAKLLTFSMINNNQPTTHTNTDTLTIHYTFLLYHRLVNVNVYTSHWD